MNRKPVVDQEDVEDCDACHLKFDKRYVGWDEWKRAIRASYQALEDEKAAEDEVTNAYSRQEVWRFPPDQQEAKMAPAQAQLDRVRARVHSWQKWFERNVP